MGKALTSRTDPTDVDDPVNVHTSQALATISECIPMADKTCPNHKFLKFLLLKDLKAKKKFV